MLTADRAGIRALLRSDIGLLETGGQEGSLKLIWGPRRNAQEVLRGSQQTTHYASS